MITSGRTGKFSALEMPLGRASLSAGIKVARAAKPDGYSACDLSTEQDSPLHALAVVIKTLPARPWFPCGSPTASSARNKDLLLTFRLFEGSFAVAVASPLI